MSGIDRITSKIIDQARLQAENRVNYARETAEKAESNIQKRFDRTIESERKKAEQEGAEAAKRILANVMLEGRKKKLSARQNTVNLVFDRAVEKMAGFPEQEYIKFLAKLASTVLDKGENKLILNARDKENVSSKLLKELVRAHPGMKISLADETVSSAGGLVVRNGDIQTNLTLESIIRLEREKLEADVVGLLFESE